MTSAYPAGLDNFTDPTDTDNIQNTTTPEVDLANLLSDHNDAIEKIQAAIGVTSSAVTSSVQYRLNNLGAAAIEVREVGAAVVTAGGDGGLPSGLRRYRPGQWNSPRGAGCFRGLRCGTGACHRRRSGRRH